jgi:CDP-diacylglycerol---serine O-phosphatidyltransferase
MKRPGLAWPGGGGPGRPPLQRGIIILPSAFTLGSLFFGVYALVTAARGDLIWAGWYIVFAAILDLVDGRVARFTRTGSSFGAELDSLVDAISFGVAPAFILYQLYFADAGWGWILCFVYVTAVVLRLARFNVEQAGEAKTHFHGLPSPTAGMILATFYPFSQTAFFQSQLAHLPWPQIMVLVTVILSVLLMSHVPYAVVPRISFQTRRGLFNIAWMATGVFLAITVPRYYFFPALVLYTTWGLVKSLVLGLLDRLPERDPLLDQEDEEVDDSGAEIRDLDYRDVAPVRFRKGRRRKPLGSGGVQGEGRKPENHA